MDENNLLKDKREHGYENYTDNVIISCDKGKCKCNKNCEKKTGKCSKVCCKNQGN